MSECVACGRPAEGIPIGPSRPLCVVCQLRLVHGDPAVETALAPEAIEEEPDDSFLRVPEPSRQPWL